MVSGDLVIIDIFTPRTLLWHVLGHSVVVTIGLPQFYSHVHALYRPSMFRPSMFLSLWSRGGGGDAIFALYPTCRCQLGGMTIIPHPPASLHEFELLKRNVDGSGSPELFLHFKVRSRVSRMVVATIDERHHTCYFCRCRMASDPKPLDRLAKSHSTSERLRPDGSTLSPFL